MNKGTTELNVLYEDNHLLVVVKPPMMPVQADASGDRDLLQACKDYLKVKYQKPGAVYLGLVHRLDRPVGGVMVFARTSKAAARLQASMQRGVWKKEYLALLEGSAGSASPTPSGLLLPEQGRLEDWMVKGEDSAASRGRVLRAHSSVICDESSPGAKFAALDYRVLARREGLILVRVVLHTGRHHQIRLQFASRGWPIWGDARYNPKHRPGQDIALWASGLELEHPVRGASDKCGAPIKGEAPTKGNAPAKGEVSTNENMLRFSALPPSKAPWKHFSDVMAE